jgi:hypothetical protein
VTKRRSVYTHTFETIAALHARYIDGEEPASLAAELGISKGALVSQFHHKGLGAREKRHWWSVAELNLAKQRILKGDDIEDIARQMGVKEERLYRALLKWGFNPTPYTSSSARVARRKEDFKIFSLRQKGMSYFQIARELGWADDQSGQRRVGRRIKVYCQKVGIPIPLVGVVLRRDGTRRRVGYGKRIKDAIKRDMAARQGKDFT